MDQATLDAAVFTARIMAARYDEPNISCRYIWFTNSNAASRKLRSLHWRTLIANILSMCASSYSVYSYLLKDVSSNPSEGSSLTDIRCGVITVE